MRLVELSYFLAVVDTGSFGKAARSLNLQTSTLSRAISKLEDKLGVSLVERTLAGCHVTRHGHIAAQRIRRVMNEANALTERSIQNTASMIAEVHIGFHLPPVNATLTNFLLEWRIICPGISVTPHEPNETTLQAALLARQIDAALLPNYLLPRCEAQTPIYFEPLMAVLPSDHPLAERMVLRWNDLTDEKLLLWSWAKEGIGRDFFATRLPDVSMQVFETSNMTLLAFVRAGYGVTITAQAYSTLNLPGLTFIPIDEADAHIEVNLVWRAESEDPVVGKFVAFMRDRAKRHWLEASSRAASESPDPPP